MKRRDFITLIGGTAVAWPLSAGAQEAAVPVVGFLQFGTPEAGASTVLAFRDGLGEVGYVEGRNVAVEYRWAQNDNARLPELAADLVRRKVAVIAVPGGTAAALAAKAATASIPIVFSNSVDPVQLGLVASLNRPDSNATGVISMNAELGAKRFGLLHEIIPAAARIAVLVDPTSPSAEPNIVAAQTAGATLRWQIEYLNISTSGEMEVAFASFAQKRIDAIFVENNPFFISRRVQVVALATRYALPTMYADREFTEIGGLMSYGTRLTDLYRQVGIYTGRILKGEKPADLPVIQPTKFELVINLKTAKALGLAVPQTLLAVADEVIEEAAPPQKP